MMDDPGIGSGEAAPDEHAVQLTAWDVPSAIGADERFRVSVGVRCRAGCGLGGHALSLFDQDGARVGTATLGHEVWPGTEALHCCEVEAKAPPAPGSHRWEIRTGDWTTKVPHSAGSLPIVVRVVSAPDCEVTVRVVDRETQAPVKGVRVVMHPYRAVTDTNGMAKIKVTRGPYDILVSGSRYVPASTRVEIIANLVTCAELDADTVDEIPE